MYDLLAGMTAEPNGEKLIRLGGANQGTELILCPPQTGDPAVRGARFRVRESNVVLDCGGVVFDGSKDYSGATDPTKPVTLALDFVERSRGIHDVVVRNCTFTNYPTGIIVDGPEFDEPSEKGLTNITLQDIVLSEINGTAIQIGPHNRDNLLERVKITKAKIGVNLRPHSSRTTIREGHFTEIGGWGGSDAGDGREAIAIDGSSHNMITDSYFYHNRFAGIALYKHCGQGRTAGAHYNIIERNEFYNHDHPTHLTRGGGAIVIASRQGLDLEDSKDAFGGATCEDPPLETPSGDRYRDFARYNVVRRNAFAFNLVAIRVRDSFNRIEGNTFMGDSWTGADNKPRQAKYDVVADAELLMHIEEPATGISVIDNVTLTKTDPIGGPTFVPLWGATMLLANNVDRSYQCVADSLAPGNLCNPATLADPTPCPEPCPEPVIRLVDPLDRCEVAVDVCPARNEWVGFPDFPGYWLDTEYGANILPDRCEARAREVWDWCKVDDDDDFTVTTTAVVDGYRAEPMIYEGPVDGP